MPTHRVSPALGPATMRDHEPVGADGRRLHLAVPRLDDVLHGALQMALLGVLRAHAPDLAAIEDLRLAVDEVLLGTAIVDGLAVRIDATLTDRDALVSVRVDAPIDVPTDILSSLVDDVVVERPDERATVVHVSRRWPHPDPA